MEALDLGANDYVTKPVDLPVASRASAPSWRAATRRTGAERERGALRAGRAGGQRRPVGLEAGDRDDLLLAPRGRRSRLRGRRAANVPDSGSSRVHPDDIDRLRRESDSTHTWPGLTPHFEVEHRLRHRDGQVPVGAEPGRGRAGRRRPPVRLAGSLTDITEGKVADALTGLPNRCSVPRPPGPALRDGKAAARACDSPCSSWTWTASRPSTTASATSWATSC